MPNLIRIPVDGVDDLLNAAMYGAGALVRVQTAATEAGAYANVGSAALVSGTRIYTVHHTAGTSTDWYRTRYENAGGTVLSDWSDPFQVGDEEAGYLCSLYDVKQQLGIPDAKTDNDEQLLGLIRDVAVEIERYTGRDFTGDRQDGTYTFDIASTTTVLWVKRGIQSVTTLEIAGGTGEAYSTLATFFLRPKEPEWLGEPYSRIELEDDLFSAGYDTVRVTGKLGWAAVPREVARIARSSVVAKWLTKGAQGPRAIVGENGQAIILRDVSPADMSILDRFRVPVIG